MPSTDRNITLSVDGHFNLKREKWHFRTGIHELMKIALKIDVSAKTIQCTEYEIMYSSMVIRYMKICNCKTALERVLTAFHMKYDEVFMFMLKPR